MRSDSRRLPVWIAMSEASGAQADDRQIMSPASGFFARLWPPTRQVKRLRRRLWIYVEVHGLQLRLQLTHASARAPAGTTYNSAAIDSPAFVSHVLRDSQGQGSVSATLRLPACAAPCYR